MRDDAEGILQEGNDDEESANGGEVASDHRSVSIEELFLASMFLRGYSRLNWLTEGVEKILDLAGVRANLVKDSTILLLRGAASIVLSSSVEAIARRSTLRHDCFPTPTPLEWSKAYSEGFVGWN